MKVYFLSPEAGCRIFSKNRYVARLQPLEIVARTHGRVSMGSPTQMRVEALQHYCKNILPFTKAEQEAILWYVKMVCQLMQQKANRFFPAKWKFLKLREHLDWNFPYTLGANTIVLSEVKVREMLSAYCSKIPDLIVSGMKTLFHEAVHLHQKRNPDLYQKIYHDAWGFHCVDPRVIHYSPFYLNHWVTNPDAMRISYIIPIVQSGSNGKTDWFLPLLILDPKHPRVVKGILIKLNQVLNRQTGKHEYYTTDQWRTICSLREYNQKFYGMQRQLYHPHEIMANLLTDYVVTYKEYTDSAFRSTTFYSTIDRLLNTRYQ